MTERTTRRTVRKGMSDYYWLCAARTSDSYQVKREYGPTCAEKLGPQARQAATAGDVFAWV